MSAFARPRVETIGVEVGRQDSLWGRECSGYFSSRGSVAFGNPRVLPAGKPISNEQRNKEQERAR